MQSPEIVEEVETNEALDLPWQVVVHNDPVNLMTYVTMVFQRVFGYPREKAEKHMLEVHRNGPLHIVERRARAGRAICPAAAWLSASGHDGAQQLRWKFAGNNGMLWRFPNSIRF